MVLAAVFSSLDDACGAPISQALGREHQLVFFSTFNCFLSGHALYGRILKPVLLPMLPDTLCTAVTIPNLCGTTNTKAYFVLQSFLKVAQAFKTKNASGATVFLKDLIKVARQDSGSLEAFQVVVAKYGIKCGLMASEIEVEHLKCCGSA